MQGNCNRKGKNKKTGGRETEKRAGGTGGRAGKGREELNAVATGIATSETSGKGKWRWRMGNERFPYKISLGLELRMYICICVYMYIYVCVCVFFKW